MTERKALKLALEALEGANSCIDGYYIPKGKTHLPEIELAITAIKEALAQPEQEPVAWMDDYNACKCPDNEARCFSDKVFRMMQKHTNSLVKRQEPVAKVCHDLDGHIGWNPNLKQLPNEGTPLYTTPPQRKPLTDEEERKAFEQWYVCNAFDYERNPIGSRECGLQWSAWKARAAHGIKGEA